jgi:hypothetical protein
MRGKWVDRKKCGVKTMLQTTSRSASKSKGGMMVLSVGKGLLPRLGALNAQMGTMQVQCRGT